MHTYMKMTLNIDDKIMAEAARLTGIKEKTALVRRGMEALIAKESGRRLAALGGSEKDLKAVPRRRMDSKLEKQFRERAGELVHRQP